MRNALQKIATSAAMLALLAACGMSVPRKAGSAPPTRREPVTYIHGMPTTGLTRPETAQFDAMLVDFMQKEHIPGGAATVVKDGRLVYARGYGYADREAHTLVQPTSLFRIASVSKPITAAAVLSLVQAPRYHLSLETRAFPLLGLQPLGQEDPRLSKITIRQLLEHAGGWDRDKSGDMMFEQRRIAHDLNVPLPIDHTQLLRWAMGQPLDFDPGTRFAYSNFGYCVLGRIIEKVTGQSYEQYVRRHVLAPLGIRQMRIGGARPEQRFPGEVVYYDPQNRTANPVDSPDTTPQVPLPYAVNTPEFMDSHGGWIASAVDLARFAAALDNPAGNPVLEPQTMAAMVARPPAPLGRKADGTPTDTYYALGWMVRPVGNEGKANYWHTGAMAGTSSIVVRLADGRDWVLLLNLWTTADIDGLMHRAAATVAQWPDQDLFAVYP